MNLKRTLKSICAHAARGLAYSRLIPSRIIIHMDGGICSQMHFYLVGMLLARHGYHVAYDLSWFRDVGTDLDGRMCRNFDLLRIFPDLRFEESRNKFLNRIYISLFYCRNDYFNNQNDSLGWLNTAPPAYLDGYFRDPEEMYSRLFREVFQIDTRVLDNSSLETLRMIEEAGADSCAIHVRRGDLARYNAAYGHPAETDYFKECVRQVAARCTDPQFFLFSDEPDWCESHLIPELGDCRITVCAGNGSDKGWCDLILMSRCRHHITSQGSMGKYAALLRDDKNLDGLVTLPPNTGAEDWKRRYDSSVIVGAGL